MTVQSAPLNELADDLRNGHRDVLDYIEDVCNRIDTVEPEVRALVPESDRESRVKNEASKLQERYTDSDELPPLFGIPVGVKDIFHVDGLLTKANSDVPPEVLTGPEADAVKTLREAGALILGKTVTTEFACFNPGPTRNPHNLDHTPGGSSSGSAAAVAAGMCPLALGSQTGGSTIRPAAYCGIVGFKPTLNRISTTGMLPLSESADHVGLFTQDVPGMQLAASVLCQNWNSVDSDSSPILGVPAEPYLSKASEEGLNHFEDHIDRLKNAGYTIKKVEIFEDIDEISEGHQKLLTGEIALSDHHEWFEEYGDQYSPMMADLVRDGRDLSVEELAFAQARAQSLRNEIEETMANESIDIIISPAATGPAPEGLESTGDYIMNLPWTYAGVPALTVPADLTDSGLPLGLHCVTKFEEDEKLLSWGEDLATTLTNSLGSARLSRNAM